MHQISVRTSNSSPPQVTVFGKSSPDPKVSKPHPTRLESFSGMRQIVSIKGSGLDSLLRSLPTKSRSRNDAHLISYPGVCTSTLSTAGRSRTIKLNLLVLKLSRQLCSALKETPSDSSEDEAADMRQVRHPTALHVRHGTSVEQLRQEPEAD